VLPPADFDDALAEQRTGLKRLTRVPSPNSPGVFEPHPTISPAIKVARWQNMTPSRMIPSNRSFFMAPEGQVPNAASGDLFCQGTIPGSSGTGALPRATRGQG
jgi:hypothetical protein